MNDKKKKNGKKTEPETVEPERTEGEPEQTDEDRLAAAKAKYPELLAKVEECQMALEDAINAKKNLETDIGELVGHGGVVAIDGTHYLVRNRPDKQGGGLMLIDAGKRAAAAAKTAEKLAQKLANPM
jgi:hypothetical protein